jgi:hypothetical protein
MYVLLDSSCCQYFNVTLNPVADTWILAGGVFNFRKDYPAYSIKADDYPAKQLFVASANMRMYNKCFLYVMQDGRAFTSNSPVQTQTLSMRLSSMSIQCNLPLQLLRRCRSPGSACWRWLPTFQHGQLGAGPKVHRQLLTGTLDIAHHLSGCIGRWRQAGPSQGGCQITVDYLEHPALEPAEHNFNSSLCSMFSADTLPSESCMISYLISSLISHFISYMKFYDMCPDIIQAGLWYWYHTWCLTWYQSWYHMILAMKS